MKIVESARSLAAARKRNLIKSTRQAIHTALRNQFVPEWIVPVEQPVVWVCQPARSGGTMLVRLFDGHPEVHVRPTPLNFGSHTGWPSDPEDSIATLRKFVSLARFNRRGFSKGASNADQEQIPVYFDKRWFDKILDDRLKDCSSGRQAFDALNTAFFNAWRNYQNLYGSKRKVMFHSVLRPDKSLDIAYENFFKTYPDGHVVFTARNPADWLASAVTLERSNRYVSELPTALEAYVQYFRALRRFPDPRVVILEFDQLVREPESSLQGLCETVGVQYCDSFQATTMNRIPLAPNSSFKFAKSFIPDVSVLGRGDLVREEAARLAHFSEACDLFEEVSNLALKAGPRSIQRSC